MTHRNECWMTADSVSVSVCGGSREIIIDQLIALLERTGCVTDRNVLKTDILKREALGSTAMEDGIVLPHAASEGVSAFCAALAVVEGGGIWLLTAWPDVSYRELKNLSAFIEVLMKEENRAFLRSATDPAAVFSWLREQLSLHGTSL